jgi:hypothetical protein
MSAKGGGVLHAPFFHRLEGRPVRAPACWLSHTPIAAGRFPKDTWLHTARRRSEIKKFIQHTEIYS